MRLHSTFQSNIFYIGISKLPKEIQEKILDSANLEYDRSSYTVSTPTVFLRGEIELEGVQYDFEVTLYTAQVSDLIDGMDAEDLEEILDGEDEPSEDWIEERCLENAAELLSYGESHHNDVYLTVKD
jgi:hypothetical protein